MRYSDQQQPVSCSVIEPRPDIASRGWNVAYVPTIHTRHTQPTRCRALSCLDPPMLCCKVRRDW